MSRGVGGGKDCFMLKGAEPTGESSLAIEGRVRSVLNGGGKENLGGGSRGSLGHNGIKFRKTWKGRRGKRGGT